MHFLHAKKEDHLGNLFADYVPQQLEEVKPTYNSNPSLDAVLAIYQEELARPYDKRGDIPGPDYNINTRIAEWKGSRTLLSPAQINAFLQATACYEDYHHYWRTGPFVEGLLKKSYENGYNDFTLNVSNLTMRNFHGRTLRRFGNIRKLRGTHHSPFRLSIYGDMDHIGEHSAYLHCTIHGNVQFILGFAGNIEHGSYRIFGNVKGNGFAARARHSDFFIDGDIEGQWVGGHRAGDEEDYARYCRFKTPRQSTLEKFKEKVPVGAGNQVIFVEEDGTQRVVREG